MSKIIVKGARVIQGITSIPFRDTVPPEGIDEGQKVAVAYREGRKKRLRVGTVVCEEHTYHDGQYQEVSTSWYVLLNRS